jgi:pimeloyl-ACP methyl ester carboxylesterase
MPPDSARKRSLPPRPLLLALEGPRAVLEAQSLVPALPLLRSAPRGDGHAVLVLPGFSASDRSTELLRRYLAERGYAAYGWGLGRNLGGGNGTGRRLDERLSEIAGRHPASVSLVGWSLGGVLARELAKRAPERVRQVITLASPFGGSATGHEPGWLHEAVRGEPLSPRARAWLDSTAAPPPVPSTAIYSRSDGVVAWRACREPEAAHTDNLEIVGSHCGLGAHPLVLYAIADRLAQPTGSWKPFDRSGWRSALYR